jgi:hypothetical protein
MYVYDTVIVFSNMLTNKSFWRWAIYWLKHIKDNKFKHENISITLDGGLKILYTIISVTDQDETKLIFLELKCRRFIFRS